MQLERKPEKPDKSREESVSKGSPKKPVKVVEDSSMKILAWILLTLGLGLCIIASVICIVLWVNGEGNSPDLEPDTTEADQIQTDREDISASLSFENEGNFNFSLELYGKLSDTILVPQSKQGCSETSCRIDCSDSANIYNDTADIMNASQCDVITTLLIANLIQDSIENEWIDLNATVLKVVLTKSRLMKIKSGSFNSPMFSKVFHMTWTELELQELSNGALLGLYSLKKLEIHFKMPNMTVCFLQPIQVTLTHLRINSGISFKSNLNIFENMHMSQLIHLDLSQNSFSGPLSKRIFTGTPNVAYLYLKYCSITAIEDSAFEDLSGKLILIDLKHNLLTQIGADALRVAGTRLLFDLEPNLWNCNCELQSMVNYFKENKSLFISTPYCRMPYNLYGKGFDELNILDLKCDSVSELPYNRTTTETVTATNKFTTKTVPRNELTTERITGESIFNDEYEEMPTNETLYGAILQFSCSEAIELDKNVNTESSGTVQENIAYNTGTLVFEPPTYDLDLEILADRSVRAVIDGYQISDQLNIIWFTDDSDIYVINASEMDYNCMQYEEPYLMVEPLLQNHTYTFCMMPMNALVISPLFCQPLYIPIAKAANDTGEIWIPESEKQFTIAMLCLIFCISTVFGGIFAYLGIKSFPHLLEGSKNVLVIKESDRNCNVSTITDSIYAKPPLKNHLSTDSFQNGYKKSSELSKGLSCAELPSIVSFRSSSTCFEESFSNTDIRGIEYEMPMQFKKDLNKTCNINKSLDRPNSPPPLPKRNSAISLGLEQKLATFKNP